MKQLMDIPGYRIEWVHQDLINIFMLEANTLVEIFRYRNRGWIIKLLRDMRSSEEALRKDMESNLKDLLRDVFKKEVEYLLVSQGVTNYYAFPNIEGSFYTMDTEILRLENTFYTDKLDFLQGVKDLFQKETTPVPYTCVLELEVDTLSTNTDTLVLQHEGCLVNLKPMEQSVPDSYLWRLESIIFPERYEGDKEDIREVLRYIYSKLDLNAHITTDENLILVEINGASYILHEGETVLPHKNGSSRVYLGFDRCQYLSQYFKHYKEEF